MTTGQSAEELRKRLQHSPQLPGKTTQKIIAGVTGKKSISTAKAKQIIPKIFKRKSKLSREKKYREFGLTYREKKGLEKIIAGGKTAEQLRKEKERYDIVVKRNKARARYEQNVQAEGSGMADKLIKGRMAAADDYHDKRSNRADKAIKRVMEKGGRKVGFSDIGVEGRKYKQFAAADDYVEEGGGIEKNTAEQRSSITRPTNAISVAGVGLLNRKNVNDVARKSKIVDLNSYRNSKLGGSVPPSGRRDTFIPRTGTNG